MRRNINCLIVLCSTWLVFVFLSCSHKNMASNGEIKSHSQEIDQYRLKVACAIFNNWAFDHPPELDKNSVAKIVIKVMPDGEIKDIFFVNRSGSQGLDDSAYKAISKSNPTIPFPKRIVAQQIELGLRFGHKEARCNCRTKP